MTMEGKLLPGTETDEHMTGLAANVNFDHPPFSDLSSV